MAAKKKNLPLARAYQLLEPGPVVLLTTSHKGRDNVMTMSWHTMMEFEPPLIGCVVSGNDYSFDVLLATRECVISIPTADMAKKVVGVGNTSGKKTDKFEKFHLTRAPAAKVKAPLIAECYASLECRVRDTRWVEKYNFFMLEVVKAWLDPSVKNPKTLHHRGKGVFAVDGKVITLPSRMK